MSLHYAEDGDIVGSDAIIIIIIIIIIGKDTISFMQGIYTCIPETNHVPQEYNVAAILSLLNSMVPISLAPALALMYFHIIIIIIIIIIIDGFIIGTVL
jgi:hypothetical protein